MLDLLRVFAVVKVLPCSLNESSIWYFLLPPGLDGFIKVPFNVSSMRKTTAASKTETEIMTNAVNVFSIPIDLNLPAHMFVHLPVQLVSSCWGGRGWCCWCSSHSYVRLGFTSWHRHKSQKWMIFLHLAIFTPPPHYQETFPEAQQTQELTPSSGVISWITNMILTCLPTVWLGQGLPLPQDPLHLTGLLHLQKRSCCGHCQAVNTV